MGASVMPETPQQDDPMLRLRYYRDTGQKDEAAHFEQYLRSTGQYVEPHATASPTLAALSKVPSVASESTGALARNRPNPTGDAEAVGPAIAANVASAAQVIPGMERVEAGVRSVVRHQPYSEALSDMRAQTDKIPTPIKIAGKMIAGGPLAGALPASPVISGAITGAADQALSADSMSPEERAQRTVVGGVGGAAVGKLVVDPAVTVARALFAKNAAKTMLSLKAARSASAGPSFDAAMREGAQNGTTTPAIHQFLNQPDIKEIADGLLATRQFAGKQAHDPEVLDAIYKTLSDQSGQIARGQNAITPSKPNIGRFRAQDIRAAKDEGLAAMSGTPASPGPMPSYREGVDAFAQGSRQLEAAQRGADVVRTTTSKSLPAAKNLTRTSPEAFSEWAAQASPEEREAAQNGILGNTKTALTKAPFTKGPKVLLGVPKLLRATGTPQQNWIESMQNLGLLTAGNQSTSP